MISLHWSMLTILLQSQTRLHKPHVVRNEQIVVTTGVSLCNSLSFHTCPLTSTCQTSVICHVVASASTAADVLRCKRRPQDSARNVARTGTLHQSLLTLTLFCLWGWCDDADDDDDSITVACGLVCISISFSAVCTGFWRTIDLSHWQREGVWPGLAFDLDSDATVTKTDVHYQSVLPQ